MTFSFGISWKIEWVKYFLKITRIMKYKGILYRSVLALRVIFDQNSVLVTLSQPLALSDLSTGDP